jgi:2-keto-4-pentenoate hydratase/2-oxohepta-3-ene-1,7-dioic acid hydratase in catechol pathway
VRLATFAAGDERRVGAIDPEDQLRDVTALVGTDDLADVIRRWEELSGRLKAEADSAPLVPAGARWLAPFPRPARNVFCIGKNYREHVQEVGDLNASDGRGAEQAGQGGLPPRPIVFTKPPSAVIGPDAPIDPHPGVTAALDYEAELAVIIGPGGADISAEDAARHIWGYTIVNDVTARDRQREHGQWFLGKGLDTFCPMGPWAASTEEVDPAGGGRPDVTVRCWVNGELRQQGCTRNLIFDIPQLIATLSAGLTLEPGDVISTGTPAGVGIGFNPPRLLHPGDVVEIAIDGLGRLRNPVGNGIRP